ncbi:MAG: hypothetical protein AAFV53_20850 [Myxococcota bacterium]
MAKKKARGPIRYRKTEHKFLEDLVLLLRTAGELGLDMTQPLGGKAKQVYAAAELADWQQTVMNHPEQVKRFDYLEPDALREVFPDTDGIFSDALLEKIMVYQAADHQRIFRVMKDGAWRYGCYQGLHEWMRYTELAPCPPELTLAMHLTKKNVARGLLDAVPVVSGKVRRRQRTDPGFQAPAGVIVPLGRYIHAFGWFVQEADGTVHASAEHWPMRSRLFKRFRDRVGIGIDMPALRKHYEQQSIDWSLVCGLNPIGTVIFFESIPPSVFVVRGRMGGGGGEPYGMEELWQMTDEDVRP